MNQEIIIGKKYIVTENRNSNAGFIGTAIDQRIINGREMVKLKGKKQIQIMVEEIQEDKSIIRKKEWIDKSYQIYCLIRDLKEYIPVMIIPPKKKRLRKVYREFIAKNVY